ncbi:SIMPL domain-containing protein [[Mycobacterium] wendilense]|uniref:SIMPL domain-containing protein n=1 Tax=[Mycobacterium] wendilense TaxID=3064284 RepID=A0ABN9NV29_9MYCO|nr:SIMPL domain-containing protein [Mycolicibacterium sp. MU0050]CAJ1579131.1 SIMPL domain-containing protein [Mycolicibacterium sp. MU0050]
MPTVGNLSRLRRLSATLIAGLTVFALTACDAAPVTGNGNGGTGRQVTVVGSGQVDGTPDTLVTNVAVSFVAPQATAALNQTNERQRAVVDALLGAGVDREDIATSQVNLQPRYEPDGTTVVAYQATNAIDVTLRDVSAASRALALITSIGGDATRINSVAFSIEDDSQLVTDARARAFEDARRRAEQYAELSGLQLGDVISISEAGEESSPPTPTPMPRAMATDVPLSPGEQTVSFSVTVVWELS